jgi:hypothetical protein
MIVRGATGLRPHFLDSSTLFRVFVLSRFHGEKTDDPFLHRRGVSLRHPRALQFPYRA